MDDVLGNIKSLVASLCFFTLSVGVTLIGQYEGVARILFHSLVNIGLWIRLKVIGSVSVTSTI